MATIQTATIQGEVAVTHGTRVARQFRPSSSADGCDAECYAFLSRDEAQQHLIDNFPAAEINGVPLKDIGNSPVSLADVQQIHLFVTRHNKSAAASGSVRVEIIDIMGGQFRATLGYHDAIHLHKETVVPALSTSLIRCTFDDEGEAAANLAVELHLVGHQAFQQAPTS